jgi:uncharacterized protein YjbI with pentapeptide repeats
MNNCRLYGARFSGTNLNGAILAGCKLQDSRFKEAEMVGSDLSRADLTNNQINHCDLTKANLARCTLEQADLSNSNLSGADLQAAKLPGVQLKNASLQQANLAEAVLARADLQAANLMQANFCGADLSGCNLQAANLQQAKLQGAKLDGADLTSVDITGTEVDNRSRFYYTKIIGLDFSTNWTLKQRVYDCAHEITIRDFRSNHPVLGFLWWSILGCGKRNYLLLVWGALFVLMFAGLMAISPASFDFGQANPNFLDHLRNSLGVFVTLDFVLEKGLDNFGRYVLTCEMICSYVMLGFVASLFSNIFPQKPQ